MEEGTPVLVRATLKSIGTDRAKVWIETFPAGRMLALVKAGDILPSEPRSEDPPQP